LPNAEWRDINRGNDAELLRLITDLARHTDLLVLGQHDERGNGLVPPELVGDVILNAGRPVLVVPYVGNFTEVGKHPLIAWSNAREAAHALNDALPLFQHCDLAHVLSIDARLEDGESSCAEVERHLSRHGIKTKTEVILAQDVGIMDLLLNRINDRGADLLVMGAHGHMGFPFEIRGAGTRHILRHMTVPVLMSS
jgi:nucleotide-binding universal stress UspA family protein